MIKTNPIIDEKTKFSLTYNNIWAILLIIVSFVSLYFGLDKRLTRIEDKVDNIALWTKEHQQQTVSLSQRMNENVQIRDKEISEINQTIAVIKSVLKIQ
ncbi:MAG: hypothetical protein WC241_04605 [Candidatus Paceibacterota bacterium]|jgi:hypothetical protein